MQGREEIAASLGEFSLGLAPWPANPPVKHPDVWWKSGGDPAAKPGESTPFLAPWPAGAPLRNVCQICDVEEAVLQPNLGNSLQFSPLGLQKIQCGEIFGGSGTNFAAKRGEFSPVVGEIFWGSGANFAAKRGEFSPVVAPWPAKGPSEGGGGKVCAKLFEARKPFCSQYWGILSICRPLACKWSQGGGG